MDQDDLDKLEEELQHDTDIDPPFNAGGISRNDADEPDADSQLDSSVPDDPQSDTNVDETEFYNEGTAPDNTEADDEDVPDVDSYENPRMQ